MIPNVYPQITTDCGPAEWRNESTQKPPKQAVSLHDAGAAAILDQARQDTAVIWRGDFHNAKQVLAALKKRRRAKRPS